MTRQQGVSSLLRKAVRQHRSASQTHHTHARHTRHGRSNSSHIILPCARVAESDRCRRDRVLLYEPPSSYSSRSPPSLGQSSSRSAAAVVRRRLAAHDRLAAVRRKRDRPKTRAAQRCCWQRWCTVDRTTAWRGRDSRVNSAGSASRAYTTYLGACKATVYIEDT